MRRIAFALLILQFLAPLPALAFSDVQQSPYRTDIEAAERMHLLTGYPDGTFKPKQLVTRAELVKASLGTGGLLSPAKRKCFPDVQLRQWYTNSICEAKQRRIIKGYPDGNVRPGEAVNFAEALSILLRAQRIAVIEATGNTPWYEPYVETAHDRGIISKNSYLPWEPVTRERMAQMIHGVFREDANLAYLSPGCGKREPSTPPIGVEVKGEQRSFLFHVPREYSPAKPHGLIVAFHGRTNSAEQVRGYLGIEQAGEDYLIVYPKAIKNGSSYSWSPKDDGDYLFFDRIVQSIGEQYCVNMDQIHVVGHSLGAWFANALACARGNVIRGSVTLGGSTQKAECTGAVASMVLHNPHDTLAAFSGGEQARDLHLAQNSCSAEENVPVEPRSFLCVRYTCPKDQPVLWCPHEIDTGWDGAHYPHQWPRDTGREAIKFLRSLD